MKTFFTFGSCLSLMEQFQIVFVGRTRRFLQGCWKQALPAGADTPWSTCLLQARARKSAVGPPTSWMYPLKSCSFVICLASSKSGLVAAGLDDPSLMKGQCTETASAKTAPVADEAEPDLGDSRNSAKCLVGRMIRSHIRQMNRHHPFPSRSVEVQVDSVPHRGSQNKALPVVFR